MLFRDNAIKAAYTRTPPGPCVSGQSLGSGYAWGGDWYTYPGVLFMFGQMEGRVSPYGGRTSFPTTSPTVSPHDLSYNG